MSTLIKENQRYEEEFFPTALAASIWINGRIAALKSNWVLHELIVSPYGGGTAVTLCFNSA
jgi:hypothetical protein